MQDYELIARDGHNSSASASSCSTSNAQQNTSLSIKSKPFPSGAQRTSLSWNFSVDAMSTFGNISR